MKTARVLLVALVWVASLLGVGLWAQGGRTVAPQLAPVQVVPPGAPIGDVIPSADIGFQRVSGNDPDGRIVGHIVVRINGQWHDTVAGMRMVR